MMITFATEVVFKSICLLAILCKNCSTDIHSIHQKRGIWAVEDNDYCVMVIWITLHSCQVKVRVIVRWGQVISGFHKVLQDYMVR